ncbi:EscG/YscG/SsaH family type III secretion system needle protein co-chaperone [Parashewanella tropica]|uniref:EscG/YscG/SsaH family type III secretion system needle protein co-chaperone n=1 Tax=Parashewanella tropica TaxID=2547970 RepID=UPI0010594F88|nr:EscG/YscG/SsaH family type III secretion system needle protein co-chaperone [Parashewanella tropica]
MESEHKKLLVEAALAAANHGLEKESYAIVKVFPDLIEDEEDRRICTSIIYFALNDVSGALEQLQACNSDSGKALYVIFSGSRMNNSGKDVALNQQITTLSE